MPKPSLKIGKTPKAPKKIANGGEVWLVVAERWRDVLRMAVRSTGAGREAQNDS